MNHRVVDFAMAYRSWLERSERSVHEPVEPSPWNFGVGGTIAESIRTTVRRQWEDDVLERVRRNNPPKPKPPTSPENAIASPGSTTADSVSGGASIPWDAASEELTRELRRKGIESIPKDTQSDEFMMKL